MQKHKPRGSEHFFIETQLGIVTRRGDWFHTTSEHIEKFAPGLLKVVALEKLIRDAQAWVNSADSISYTLLLGLLFFINPWIAATVTVVFHWLWYMNKSALVTRHMGGILSFINGDGFLMLTALVALSYFGIYGHYEALGIGIVFFFIMKLGLLKKVWDKFFDSGSHVLTLNDRVLKMVVIKYALYENVAPAEVQHMEDRIKELARIRKKGKR